MLPTVLICLALLLIVVFSVRSYLKKLKTGCCGSGGDQVKRVRPGDRDVSHYPYAKVVRVEGMHCQNCARRVENAFNAKRLLTPRWTWARKPPWSAPSGRCPTRSSSRWCGAWATAPWPWRPPDIPKRSVPGPPTGAFFCGCFLPPAGVQ